LLSGILEITSCIIAAIFGIVGVFYGMSIDNYNISPSYFVAVSGLLVVIVVVYLSQLAEVMQKPEKINVIICKVLNKLIYVIIIIQVITAVLTVNN
jgi:hypothetical protein